MSFEVRRGDVLEQLRLFPDGSFDACLCDPPYGLEFMGKDWDHGVPKSDVWREVLRTLKPGAFLLAFGGTRTHHRLTCAIEDAGFEIRDVMMWIFGSGFPKSLDISKAIDKALGAERQVLRAGRPVKRMIPGADQDATGSWIKDNGREYVPTETAAAAPAAKLFDGYGTALKPAYEPIIIAMKPCDGTFAENALKYGVAGIDIDGSRIETEDSIKGSTQPNDIRNERIIGGKRAADGEIPPYRQNQLGRWPANIILDERSAAALDAQTGELTSGANPSSRRSDKFQNTFQPYAGQDCNPARGADSGGASRFFYCAKASSEDRGRSNTHPTVKPQDLCRYLARLVLPPQGSAPRRLIVPFAGSGSEMLGALVAGWDEIVGIELEQKYIDIAIQRLESHCPLLV